MAASSTTNPVVSESAPLVLIVEDNADLRYYLRSQLSDNYRIAEAENGKKGVALAQEYMPDLVISDVMMPETDGFELCHQLKTDERTCHIPVILLTALASPENKLAGLDNRADDYIIKPFMRMNCECGLAISSTIAKCSGSGSALHPAFSRQL
ncbi:MAG: response regulator [Calditrichae bacterium]|nr:response regulator [Calditrichia bacterium]